jgi:NAD+ synthase
MVATTPSEATTDYGRLAAQIAGWLRAQLEASGARGFVLGLSGGIDSAVVCALCARATSPAQVLGAFMPSHSNPEDEACADEVAAAFDIKLVRVNLTPVTDEFEAAMPADELIAQASGQASIEAQARLLADANVKPRMRMATLYYLANLTNSIVVGTGNKTEAAIGYFTKYGDGGVDLLPIVDLYKFEVRALARELGVPTSVIERAPSAGLWPGQTDEHEIGLTYDQLDAALMAIASGSESGVAPAVIERVKRMNARTAHKRGTIPAFIRPF